jgi:chemotaxis protein MotB
MLKRIAIYVLPILCLHTSCIVSKKKFDDLLAQRVRIEADLAERDTAVRHLEGTVEVLKDDTTSLGQRYRQTNVRLSLLDKEYTELDTHYKNLLSNSGKINRDMASQQEQFLMIKDNLERTRKMNDSLSVSLAEREVKVKELEQILAKKDKAVTDLKNKVTNALLNFKENDLTVEVKNGKVYVSLAEQLLFGSGSIDVDQKGVSALQQLGKAIKDQKDINIMVEGHTDNVPVSKKSQYMQDNWDLSVMRATSITKILTRAGVSPQQITAAGRGEFVPLLANDTQPNKQKNRRTEIIITPDLGELFKILETN